MLAAYFDDGGDDDVVSVIAGYVGEEEEWELLEAEWNRFLVRHSLSFYHSVDSSHTEKLFSGRTHQECNDIHKEAIEIITPRKLIPIAMSVHRPSHNQYRSTLPPSESSGWPKTEFYFCFRHILAGMARLAPTMPMGEKISMVIEETPLVEGKTVDLFNVITKEEQPHLSQVFEGPPAFRPKKGYPQLQAADVLAYEWGLQTRRHYKVDRPDRKIRESMRVLAAHSEKHGGALVQAQWNPQSESV